MLTMWQNPHVNLLWTKLTLFHPGNSIHSQSKGITSPFPSKTLLPLIQTKSNFVEAYVQVFKSVEQKMTS